jgi:hypothetical protein
MKRMLLITAAALCLPLTCILGFSCLPTTASTPSHVHTFSYVGGNEPTCIHYGNHEFWICTKCGSRYTDDEGVNEIENVDIEPLSHEFEGSVCTLCNGVLQDGLVYVLDDSQTFYTVQAADTSLQGEVDIPESFNDLPVCRIAENGFYDCDEITSVVIPDSIGASVTNICRIGRNAFDGCTSLENVYYFGSAYEWSKIFIEDHNETVKDDSPYYYSERYPYDNRAADNDKYWHYASDGVTPVVWEKNV